MIARRFLQKTSGVSVRCRYAVVPSQELKIDITNAKELSKANDGANPEAFKEHLHVIKHFLDRYKNSWFEDRTNKKCQQMLGNHMF